MRKFIKECHIMFKRQNALMLQSPDAIVMAVMIPALIMLLFVSVFGGAMDVGSYNYVNFITFGVIMQASMQSSAITSINVNKDMNTGMIERFRSMPIAKISFLIGHVVAGTLRNMLSVVLMLGVAFIMGFRPTAGLVEWAYILGILLLVMFMLAWLSVFVGVAVKSGEAASGFGSLVAILAFLSSGFAPIDTLASGLQPFARHQPLTHIIDTLRGLSMGGDIGNTWALMLVWCVGLVAFFTVATLATYLKKITV